MGARARARLRQRHLVAREPPEERLHDDQHAVQPDGRRHRGAVLLPLPDRAPHLLGDADLNPVAARPGGNYAYGALAPPVGLDLPSDLPVSFLDSVSFSPAEVPPPVPPA